MIPELVAATLATFTITPAATGKQLVRASVAGVNGTPTTVTDGKRRVAIGWRPLGRGGGLVTFPWNFPTRKPVAFSLMAGDTGRTSSLRGSVSVAADGALTIAGKRSLPLTLSLTAPERTDASLPAIETVEHNAHYLWRRFTFADPHWPRVIEVREDSLGGVVVVAHLQKVGGTDGWAPEFGWDVAVGDAAVSAAGELSLAGGKWRLYHPTAPLRPKATTHLENGRYSFRACQPEAKTPMQPFSWRRAEFVLAPVGLAKLPASLTTPHDIRDARHVGEEALPETVAKLVRYTRDAIVKSMCHGDDLGNVTGFGDANKTASSFGMNRLNHCPPIFQEGYRNGDRRLVETALLWCENFYDQSIWWGEKERGGTRYNNVTAMGGKPPEGDDGTYMWRSNSSVSFCTKGYDAFYLAYRETGDPRMKEALDAQFAYASQFVHAGLNYTRNIGDVRDLLNLASWTGEARYRDDALRLWSTLKPCLSTGDLFTEAGLPIVADPPFIDDDQVGPKYPYAKPYIIGYGLSGLPELSRLPGADPRLGQVVRAVADFLVESQDPVGGWRYPHPRSSHVILSQAIEHAWQMSQLGDALTERHLDAIERVLRQRIVGFQKTGRILAGLDGWEMATGTIKTRAELYTLYKKPSDRDYSRDWREGKLSLGGAPPEGLVYFEELLRRYRAHRPVERLLAAPKPDEALGLALERTP